MKVVRDLILDGAGFGHKAHDRDRWPAWREWAADAGQIPSRAIALERLKLLGVLAGADGG